jgi:hypothetical protein
MAILIDFVLFSCVAAFVTGIVIAAAKFIIYCKIRGAGLGDPAPPVNCKRIGKVNHGSAAVTAGSFGSDNIAAENY